MHRLAIHALIFVLFVLSAGAQPAKPDAAALTPEAIGHIGHLDFRNGFRQWRFGTAASEIPNLKLEQDLGNIGIYSREGDDLRIGDVQLQRILYHFVNGQFMGVSLLVKGRYASRALHQILDVAYGKGVRPEKEQNEYFWRGNVANVRYSEDELSEDARAWIGNNALQDQSAEYQKVLVSRAASSL
ncbi:MAG TPA: hypothetical protein VMU84_01550 [Thermoanaerobaculia bacterium]|nr:hypothetical protein [Thermoanaerobaculia bacterium]